MRTNKLLTWAIIFWLTLQTVSAAYTEIQCDAPVFTQNSCAQCFDWWAKWAWDAFGFLSDVFVNKSTTSSIIYKEEQSMPFMINLGNDKSSWSQSPSWEDFWEYTPEFDALYSKVQEAYVIPAGATVKWLQSKLGYSYKLDKNTVPAWQNVWLLVYTVAAHNLSTSWEIAVDTNEHKECVLFKSWIPSTTKIPTVIENQPVKQLPQTWPEHILLMALALLLWVWLFGLKRKSN